MDSGNTLEFMRSCPPAIDELKKDQSLSETTELRRVKYLNNMVELRTHRFIKRLVNPGMGCGFVQHCEANTQRLRNDEHDSHSYKFKESKKAMFDLK